MPGTAPFIAPAARTTRRVLAALGLGCLIGGCSVFGSRPPLDPEQLQAAEREQVALAEAREKRLEERRLRRPCDRPDRAGMLDGTREMLEERSCSAALWLDGLFGDGEGDEEAAKRAQGFVELSNSYSEFEGYTSTGRLHVEVDLPNLENRFSAFIGRENDEDFVRGRSDASELRSTFPTLNDQNQWLAGFGYRLPSSERLATQLRIGVRGIGPPRLFVQSRLRFTLYSDDNDVAYLRWTPFWNTYDGFGITQNFDISHVLSSRLLLRWYTIGTVSERTEGLNWRNSLVLYQNLQQRRGLAYELFIRGETDEPEPLYEYGARTLFRHPLLDRRLFLEWAVGYSWPRSDPAVAREGSANAGVSIELPFGIDRD